MFRTPSHSAPDVDETQALLLPTLIVPQTLLLPHMSLPYPIDDGEESKVIEHAMAAERMVLVLAVRDQSDEDDDFGDEETAETLAGISEDKPNANTSSYGITVTDAELSVVGVIAEIGHKIARPGVPAHVILHGSSRGIVTGFEQREPFTLTRVFRSEDPVDDSMEARAVMANVLDQVESYVGMLANVPEEVVTMVRSVDEPGWLADLIAFSPEFGPALRQELLEVLNPVERLRRISGILQERLEFLTLRHQIQSEAQAGMDRQQREIMLREQLRTIQRELGDISSDEAMAGEFREKIEAAGMPEAVKTKALLQVARLEQQHPFSPEIGIIQSYLDWLTELPWSVRTEDQLDLAHAARILDEDHYGLTKVKERILEFIAVRKLAGEKMRSPIICFVGPPGVGKTSLGRSIARALGRSYSRMSLGGVRDEAEIRGHRRTYVGALPGRVIKAIRDAGTSNPVIVLDEIDKVGSDAFRGDPSSALLEVLDPEQNNSFSDHYLEVPFDLSQVVFITTANMLEPIPPALRDRMEIIEVPSYTEVEKLEIAKQFLIPKAMEAHGLQAKQLTMTDDALMQLIREYTHEAGVRNLDREIASVCRKVARKIAENKRRKTYKVDTAAIGDLLGIPRYEYGLASETDEVGVSTGAAVTGAGGDLLSVEVTIMKGKGDLLLTGQLGDVMQESARAAISYARSRIDELDIAPDFFDNHLIHVHVPAGAVPKDGPSAGLTIATALISSLTGIPVRKDVAMTGEITLRGKILPIGGLREKALASRRGGITCFVAPKRNEKDLTELPSSVRDTLDIRLVNRIDEALDIALTRKISLRGQLSSTPA
ncbi:MAG TPA: endopeptidase La [Thermomicrobiales bacterium]|nr:endopeptidase La [Thermomicrobiales bacterium]